MGFVDYALAIETALPHFEERTLFLKSPAYFDTGWRSLTQITDVSGKFLTSGTSLPNLKLCGPVRKGRCTRVPVAQGTRPMTLGHAPPLQTVLQTNPTWPKVSALIGKII